MASKNTVAGIREIKRQLMSAQPRNPLYPFDTYNRLRFMRDVERDALIEAIECWLETWNSEFGYLDRQQSKMRPFYHDDRVTL